MYVSSVWVPILHPASPRTRPRSLQLEPEPRTEPRTEARTEAIENRAEPRTHQSRTPHLPIPNLGATMSS